jgi:hypothetical protein
VISEQSEEYWLILSEISTEDDKIKQIPRTCSGESEEKELESIIIWLRM